MWGEEGDGFGGVGVGGGGDVEDVGGREVEVAGVPGHLRGEVVDAETEVAELCSMLVSAVCFGEGRVYFVNLSGTRFKSLECFLSRLIEFVVDFQSLGASSLVGDGCLSVDKVDGKALRVFNTEDVAATGGVSHFLDAIVENCGIGNLGDSGSVSRR